MLEDNALDAQLIENVLVAKLDYEFEFKIVTDRQNFENQMVEFLPDAVLSDYKLPQYNGFDALEYSMEKFPLTPFIMVTGTLGEEAAADAIKFGAWDYVVKERLARLPLAIDNALKIRNIKKSKAKSEDDISMLTHSTGLQSSLLHAIILNAPGSVVITNSEGVIEYVNPKFEEVTGYSKDEAIGQNPRVLKSGFHNAEFYKNLWDTLLDGKTWTGELINKNKQGEIYYEYASISPIFDPTSNCVKYLAIKNDITNLKKDEIKLLEQESLYKSIFENKLTANCLFDMDFNLLSSNSRFYEIFELDGSAKIDLRKFRNFITRQDAELIDSYAKKRMNGEINGFLKHDFKVKLGSGVVKTVSASINKIENMDFFMMVLEDTTAEEKLSRELMESEQKFRLITESAQDAIIMIGANGEITHWNPAAVKIFGFEFEEVKGKDLHMLLAPKKYLATFKEKFKEFKETGEGQALNRIVEMEAIRKDNTRIIVEISLSPLKIDTGWGAVGILRDVTERIDSQRNLMIMARAFQNIKECVSVTDKDNNIIYVNKAFVETYGYSTDELYGKNVIQILRRTDDASIKKDSIYADTLKGDWHGEIMNYHKNGTEIPVYLSTTCVKDDEGEIIALVGVATDMTDKNHTISELEKAKSALQESEERLFTYINTIPDIVCFKDGEGRWLMANDADLKLFQLESVDYYGKTDIELSNYTNVLYKKSFETCTISDEEAWAKGSLSTGTKIIPTIDSGIRIFDLIKIPIFHKNGDRKGLAVIGRDITELQKIADNLKIAKEKAEESDKLKTIFLANMSHEIRTPMNAILGYSSILSEYDIAVEDQKEYLNIIQRSGKQLLNLIDDIIDISKIETKQLKLSMGKTKLKDIVKSVYDNFVTARLTYNRPETRLIVSSVMELDEQVLLTDGGRLLQILTNLVNNALKYSKYGDIDLIYSLITRHGKPFIEFKVKDYGVGIHMDKQQIIFERFRQVEESNYRQGAGLGLSICKGLIDLLGGEIGVKSQLGLGSEFSFTIPYMPDIEYERVSSNEALRPKSLKGYTLVVGEDDHDSITYLKILLNPTGAKIFHATNGGQFMQFVKEHNPDIALLDINLPVKSGVECIKEIRANGLKTKIIAQTAYAMKEDKQRYLEMGFTDYIAKPYSRDQLLEIIYNNVFMV